MQMFHLFVTVSSSAWKTPVIIIIIIVNFAENLNSENYNK